SQDAMLIDIEPSDAKMQAPSVFTVNGVEMVSEPCEEFVWDVYTLGEATLNSNLQVQAPAGEETEAVDDLGDIDDSSDEGRDVCHDSSDDEDHEEDSAKWVNELD
ncbi:unnamed protein product, partial [Effrenium voratum]